MRNTLILVIILVFLGACTSNTIYKKPDNLIPKNQMVDLLTDMYLANAALNIKTKKLERNLDYMPLIYEKYGIDSLRFQSSNTYYMSRIDDYEAIHIIVEKNLKEVLDTAQAKQKERDGLILKDKNNLEVKNIK